MAPTWDVPVLFFTVVQQLSIVFAYETSVVCLGTRWFLVGYPEILVFMSETQKIIFHPVQNSRSEQSAEIRFYFFHIPLNGCIRLLFKFTFELFGPKWLTDGFRWYSIKQNLWKFLKEVFLISSHTVVASRTNHSMSPIPCSTCSLQSCHIALSAQSFQTDFMLEGLSTIRMTRIFSRASEKFCLIVCCQDLMVLTRKRSLLDTELNIACTIAWRTVVHQYYNVTCVVGPFGWWVLYDP